MAKVHRTATGFMVIPVDPLSFDPTVEGYTADVGGLASYNGVLYYKFGGNDTQWSAVGVVPTLHVSAPITGDGSIGSPFAISAATDSTAGSLSAPDKTLIDGIGAVSTWAPGGIAFNESVFALQKFLVGGPTVDPLFGLTNFGAFSDTNTGAFSAVVANKNTGALANSNLAFLCGSWDASFGAFSSVTLNSPNAAASPTGPQAWIFAHGPTVGAPMIFWNQRNQDGADVIFRVGTNTEVLRFVHAGAVLQVAAAGIQAAGATAVTITNSPGASATPAEYWMVKNAAGQVRYIPLLS